MDGTYLDPKPADFHDMAGKPMTPEAQGEHIAKVTFGIQDTAMPVWGEWLPWDQRWDAIKFLMGSFMVGQPVTESVYTDELPANFITLSQENWTGEGHTIDVDHGQQLYGQYCATCHGDDGQGNGSGTEVNANGNPNASGSPVPFPADMGQSYIFWRIWDGVPESVMPPFHLSFNISEGDIWDMTAYVQQLIASGSSGGTTAQPTTTPEAPAATPAETPQPTGTPGGGS
jgi:mono/diheme cytochrome c family protein